MNLTQEQWFSLLFTLGFGLAYIVGKVLEGAFKDKKVDLSMYTFVTRFAAFFSIFWVFSAFSGLTTPLRPTVTCAMRVCRWGCFF